ncbi:hypothetical protein PoB_007452400 [Plakobranchus ocellatus]|uniref:Uncharacterized protein n=1 Tax=Plakobranchus ocellatus TaxID=259542 RepID=A0AAV4DV44_9GAST|nr:hypothetical protein PoB_007452400 [Plakobranchus ocellatus]
MEPDGGFLYRADGASGDFLLDGQMAPTKGQIWPTDVFFEWADGASGDFLWMGRWRQLRFSLKGQMEPPQIFFGWADGAN